MNINIYQIDTERDSKRICFFGLDEIKKLTKSDMLDCTIYDKLFSGEVDCNNLEDVYRMFNTDRPKGYTGRSLSVSDVVEITDGESKGFYFCDNIGFEKIDFDNTYCKDLTARESISVLFIQPEKKPRMVEIPDTLEAMQKLVGGDIEEYFPFKDEVAIVCRADGKMYGLPPNRAIYAEESEKEVPTYAELKRIFRAAERVGIHLTAHITFTADSFDKEYSEQSRTYEVSSDNKAYWSKHLGLSVFGSCLDGTDQRVNLDAYMAEEHGGADGWKVEKCVLVTSEKDISDIIVGDFFIVKAPVDSDRYQSLPKNLEKKYSEKFKYPERFYRQNGEIKVRQIKPKERSDAR
ncbi:MAG: DUF3846 domain-containing protein [Ruminococcus sp.]|nr:DUF3846 domain-containing protein [Ruminococcus sp.]